LVVSSATSDILFGRLASVNDFRLWQFHIRTASCNHKVIRSVMRYFATGQSGELLPACAKQLVSNNVSQFRIAQEGMSVTVLVKKSFDNGCDGIQICFLFLLSIGIIPNLTGMSRK